MVKQVIGRFAPSPTGRLHIGNFLSALIAWLAAKSKGGTVILRIEDLDPDRSKKEYSQKLQSELRWLGLDWQQLEQNHRPYYQSQAEEFYQQAYEILKAKGLLYSCYCSRSDLQIVSAPHASDGGIVYPGICRDLSHEQKATKAEQTKKDPAIRVKVPDRVIEFEDFHYGLQKENLLKQTGDFLIQRADRVFSYQLAVVVDDLRMGITQVVRGRDLLPSTARQIWLAEELGAKTSMEYGHIPLLLDYEGKRLAKRDASIGLDFLQQKYTAPQIVGKLAYLVGLIDKPQALLPQELIPEFCWSKIPKEDIRVPKEYF